MQSSEAGAASSQQQLEKGSTARASSSLSAHVDSGIPVNAGDTVVSRLDAARKAEHDSVDAFIRTLPQPVQRMWSSLDKKMVGLLVAVNLSSLLIIM